MCVHKWLGSGIAREAWGSVYDLGFSKCIEVKEADKRDSSIILHPHEHIVMPGPGLGTKGRPACFSS